MLLLKNDPIPSHYDVVVIGSGLGGLTCANRLAKSGHKVLILESHNKLGGLATWFRRAKGEHIFDVSLHGFPYGMVKTCRKYWNKEIADAIVQVKEVRFLNPQYDIETDFTREHFIEVLTEKFGVPIDTVKAFFNELASMNFYDDQSMTTGEFFHKYFGKRDDIIRFLLEPIVYANGSTLEDPAITYGIVFSNFMNKGVYIFRGGTDHLIGLMRDELIKNGVDIKLTSKVQKINVADGKVHSVIVQNGNESTTVLARAVVSNANLKNTIFNLVGEEHFTHKYIEEAGRVRLNTSSCQVFMGIKKGEHIPHIGELIFVSDDATFSTDKLLSMDVGSQTFSVYYPDMRPDRNTEHDRYTIVSSSNHRYEDWKKLRDENFGGSEETYKKQKQFVIQRALTALEKLIPGVRDKIDYIDCSTPLTVERYTHHSNGASFGTKFEGLPISMNICKEVRGLYHSGSVGIIMSGWLGTANYGVMRAHEIDLYLDSSKGQSNNDSLGNESLRGSDAVL